MTKHTASSMALDLFLSNSLIAIHDCGTIYIAKAFNSYIAQILTPSLACSEMPGATWASLWRQIVFCIIVSFVCIHVALKVSSTVSDYNPSIQFIFKHVLAWSFKELAAIFVAMIAKNLVENIMKPERQLRDFLQGDAEYDKKAAWYLVASYVICFGIFFVIVSIVFQFMFEQIKSGYWKLNSLLFKAPWTPNRKVLFSKNDNEEIDEEREINCSLYRSCCKENNEPFYREDSDKFAYDFSNECLRTAYAWTTNGCVVGILIALFNNFDSDIDTFAFGLLEVYSLLACIIGGLIFSSEKGLKRQNSIPIWMFYWQWWATWAGLAIATLGVAPGSISSLMERSDVPELLSDLGRVLFNTVFAALFLYIGSSTRVRRKLLGCIPVSEFSGIKIGELLSTAAVLGVAVSWEDFGGDLACSFADLDEEKDGFSGVTISGIYFVIVLSILLPISLPIGVYGRKRLRTSLQDLATFHNLQTISESEREGEQHTEKS